ncbi:FecR domain-containing protein [Arsenicibacter rosenii]|uniref:Iron dicitrate transport regulator FecR n=1 Tax=Arsenicibacter rosenii TaxID=1750698 RepID=A0A1S2VIR0_9BACT|nr:FecR domain-containing protein [Arsenicibacter rosenii]OIN58629.1 hypothetical protein BLX24_13760 [Arsenicibacter rosenii]
MTPQELIDNKSFRRWVFNPVGDAAEADRIYWENLLAEHPEYQANAELARQFLLSARGDLPALSDQLVSGHIRKLMERVETEREPIYETPVVPLSRRPWRWMAIAASVTVLLLAGVWTKRGWMTPDSGYEALKEHAPTPLTEVANSGTAPRLVRLPDGSLVKLQQGARISFPATFDAGQREVYLSGTAFFEVVKNPAQPFLVYANQLTTRVVGTSFTIYAPERGPTTRVVVRTGKVAVYPVQPAKTATPPATHTVMLTANQQATYREGAPEAEKANVDARVTITPEALASRFTFRRTPLPAVFETIEQVYGIKLLYNAGDFTHCTLTTRLENESLFEKLDVITASTGATYDLTPDGSIRILPGQGCQ